MLKLMSYAPYILAIFLVLVHPVWSAEGDEVTRCDTPGADCEPAIPGLRTAPPPDETETVGPVLPTDPEPTITGDDLILTRSPEETGGGRGTELTQAEAELQRTLEEQRRREAELERSRPATPEATANLRSCERLENKAERCSCVANFTKEFQKKSLNFKLDGQPSMAELLKKRDDLTAKLAVVKTLVDVWDQYHDYLEKSPELNGTSEESSTNPMKAVNDLKGLRDFISEHSDSIQRYHLTSEVFSVMPTREEIMGLETPEAKLDYLKAKIQERCTTGGASAGSLYMCKGRAWEQIQMRTDWDTPTNSEADNLNRLVNAIVAVDGTEFLDITGSMSLSRLFVDRANINVTGMNDVSEGMTGLIDAAIASCQQEVLNPSNSETQCFNKSLTSITQNNPRLRGQFEALETNFKEVLGRNYNLDSIGGMVNAYVSITHQTREFHEEANTGTFRELANLTSKMGNPNDELTLASATLNQPETRSMLQNQFKNLTKENLAKLGRTISGMKLKESEEIYKRFGEEGSNLFGNGAFEFSNKNEAQVANNILNSILCREGSAADCQNNPINLFKDENGKAIVNEDALSGALSKLVSTVEDRGQLSDMLLPNKEGSLANEIKKIDEQIQAANKNEEYKALAIMKNYLHDRARTFCVNEDMPDNKEIQSTRCSIGPEIDVGLNDFLKVGGELISMKNAFDHNKGVSEIVELCKRMRTENYENYNTMYLQTGICPSVYDYQTELERVRTNAARVAYDYNERGIGDPNTIYKWNDDGTVASVYRVPKASNLSQYIVPAAYAFTPLIPTIASHGLFQNQVDLMRNAGIQQEYNIAFQNHVNSQYAACDPSGTGANFFAYNNCITSINSFYYFGTPISSGTFNYSGGMNFGGSGSPISF